MPTGVGLVDALTSVIMAEDMRNTWKSPVAVSAGTGHYGTTMSMIVSVAPVGVEGGKRLQNRASGLRDDRQLNQCRQLALAPILAWQMKKAA